MKDEYMHTIADVEIGEGGCAKGEEDCREIFWISMDEAETIYRSLVAVRDLEILGKSMYTIQKLSKIIEKFENIKRTGGGHFLYSR